MKQTTGLNGIVLT